MRHDATDKDRLLACLSAPRVLKQRKGFPVDRALPQSRWQALKALLEKGNKRT